MFHNTQWLRSRSYLDHITAEGLSDGILEAAQPRFQSDGSVTGAYPHGSPTGVPEVEGAHPKKSVPGSPVEQWNGVNGAVPGSPAMTAISATIATMGKARQEPPARLEAALGGAVSQPTRSSGQQDPAAAIGDGHAKDVAGPSASAGVSASGEANGEADSSQTSRQDHVSRFATRMPKTLCSYAMDIIRQLGVQYEGVLKEITIRHDK